MSSSGPKTWRIPVAPAENTSCGSTVEAYRSNPALRLPRNTSCAKMRKIDPPKVCENTTIAVPIATLSGGSEFWTTPRGYDDHFVSLCKMSGIQSRRTCHLHTTASPKSSYDLIHHPLHGFGVDRKCGNEPCGYGYEHSTGCTPRKVVS